MYLLNLQEYSRDRDRDSRFLDKKRMQNRHQMIPLGADGLVEYAALHQTASVHLLQDMARSVSPAETCKSLQDSGF